MEHRAGTVVLAHAAGLPPNHDAVVLLMAALPLIFIGMVVVAATLQAHGLLGAAGRTTEPTTALATIAAALSLGAAVIHFSVVESHLADGLVVGLFFAAVAGFQALWPVAFALRRSVALAAAAILVNAGVLGIWLVSRTAGLPFGPRPWAPEPIGMPDLLATSFEAALVVALWPIARPALRSRLDGDPVPAQKALVLTGYAIVVIVVLTGMAILSPDQHAVAATH